MFVTKQIIEIVAQVIDKATAPLRNLSKATTRVAAQQQVLNKWSRRLGISAGVLEGGMRDANLIFTKQGAILDRTTGRFIKQNKAMLKAKKAAAGFKFEWLSVMFAGMALYRVFGGLIRKQMELWGITEGYGAMLTAMFIPVMETLSPVLWSLIDFFTNLDPEIQAAIGWFAALMAALGAILAVTGSWKLAIAGIAKVFGITASAASTAILSIMAIIAGIVLIVTGVVMVIKGKLEGIGLIIMGVGAILLLFIGWWALIPIAVGAAVYLIIKHWSGLKSFLQRTFSAIGGFFKKWFWDKPKEWIANLVRWIKSKIKALLDLPIIGRVLRFTPLGVLGSFQTGGVIPKTGPYLLHKGETVIPAGATFAPTITVYATVNSDYDVRRLATELNKYWVTDFEKLVKRRGV